MDINWIVPVIEVVDIGSHGILVSRIIVARICGEKGGKNVLLCIGIFVNLISPLYLRYVLLKHSRETIIN